MYKRQDFNRANLLVAVLEKRAGYFFGSLDVYLKMCIRDSYHDNRAIDEKHILLWEQIVRVI